MQAKNLHHKLYAGLILKSTEFQLTLFSLKTLEEPREEEWGPLLSKFNNAKLYLWVCIYTLLLYSPLKNARELQMNVITFKSTAHLVEGK